MQYNNGMLVNNGNVYKNGMLMLTTINECCLGLSLLSNIFLFNLLTLKENQESTIALL